MSRKKRLIRILGPVLCSAVLVAVFFFAPFRINLTSEKTLKEASTSMAPNVLKGNVIKNKAVASGKYVPFFGSSELSHLVLSTLVCSLKSINGTIDRFY